MVAIIVISIFTTIAMSSYRRQLRRAQRNEAMQALLRAQTVQEIHFLQSNAYTSDLVATPPAGLGLMNITARGNYRIAFSASTTTTYRFTATAIGRQRYDDSCAIFAIDQSGTREAQDKNGEDTREVCWR